MTRIKLCPVLTKDLERDKFGPFLASKGMRLLLVEIKISEVETQAYVLDLKSMRFYVDNLLWAHAQTTILARALNEFGLSSLHDVPILTRKTILAGAWHFGHLIGDHAHRLVIASRQYNQQKDSRPIHFCINAQREHWIFDALFLDRKAFINSTSEDPFTDSKVRAYALDDCICFFPDQDKSIPLSMASEHVKHTMKVSGLQEPAGSKVFLTSQRVNRMVNSETLCAFLRTRGWEIVNPIEMQHQAVLSKVANAERLICENGSILFNCFLARSNPYLVLCSKRSTSYLEGIPWAGGGVYNYFHKGILSYFPCKAIVETHHPFSDLIWVDIENLDVVLDSPGFTVCCG